MARRHHQLTGAGAKATGLLEQFVIMALRRSRRSRAHLVASPRMKNQVADSCCAPGCGKHADRKPCRVCARAKQCPDALQTECLSSLLQIVDGDL